MLVMTNMYHLLIFVTFNKLGLDNEWKLSQQFDKIIQKKHLFSFFHYKYNETVRLFHVEIYIWWWRE
ncbi:hypothetical protein MLA2C4_26085 [Bacillus mobilis]|nr:hypothetical protein MLA2C4_26085 [Bacillus mobilis]